LMKGALEFTPQQAIRMQQMLRNRPSHPQVGKKN
jgi:hypothetical protein